MSKKGRSEPGLFGTINHYDEHGKKIGRSEPGMFGGYTNYDAKGRKVGHSDPGFFGSYNHYDNKGRKVGSSDPGLFGGYNHRDSKGKPSGSSSPGMFGSYNHSDSQGCYVATCVYGSYDCPQVWTLRRFRDNTLAQSFLGRAFIRLYYAVSPTIVKWFGHAEWSKKMWKSILDKLVQKLKLQGIEDSPYEDPQWKAQSISWKTC